VCPSIRRDQQHYGEGDLRDYKMRCASGASFQQSFAPSAEGLFYAAHWNPQRRRQPEKKTTQERGAHGENKLRASPDGLVARGSCWPKRNKRMNADECEYPRRAGLLQRLRLRLSVRH